MEYEEVIKSYLGFQEPPEIFLWWLVLCVNLDKPWDNRELAASVRMSLEEMSSWVSGVNGIIGDMTR